MVRRGTARGSSPSPSQALFAEAPDRRLAKGGGMREFTDKIFHRSRKRTDTFQGDVAIFFSEYLNSQLLRT